MDPQIVRTLISLGISPHHKGFLFLYETMVHTVTNVDAVYTQLRSLYPTVTKKLGVSYSRYERNLRHAIKRGWELHPDNPNRVLFALADAKWPPTNTEFIAVATIAHLSSLVMDASGNTITNDVPDEQNIRDS